MHPTHPIEPEATWTPADTLRNAAVYLTRYGWLQGAYYQPGALTPPADVLGAIAMVVYGTPVDDPTDIALICWRDFADAAVTLADHLGITADFDTDAGFDIEATIYDWNDDPGRTADEVIAALNAAAIAWDSAYLCPTRGVPA